MLSHSKMFHCVPNWGTLELLYIGVQWNKEFEPENQIHWFI